MKPNSGIIIRSLKQNKLIQSTRLFMKQSKFLSTQPPQANYLSSPQLSPSHSSKLPPQWHILPSTNSLPTLSTVPCGTLLQCKQTPLQAHAGHRKFSLLSDLKTKNKTTLFYVLLRTKCSSIAYDLPSNKPSLSFLLSFFYNMAEGIPERHIPLYLT